MDSYTYITGRQFEGYKLSTLDYRNKVDTDNRYKWKPIWAKEPMSHERAISQGLYSQNPYISSGVKQEEFNKRSK